jgi:hypothetical protein
VQTLKPGDTCYLHAGRYREAVIIEGLAGSARAPITIKAYPGDPVTIDGCEPVEGTWSKWRDGIWRARLKFDTWQLFSGEKLVQVARWPNAQFDDGSIWNMETAMRWSDRGFKRGAFTGETRDGLIVDRNPAPDSRDGDDPKDGRNRQTLAETGIAFTGAVAVLNIGHWKTWARPVLEHRAGSDRFTYDPAGTEMARHVVYHLLGLPCLDRPNEWWFDAAERMIYLKPPGDAKPGSLKLYGKVRDYGITARDCRHLRIRGLRFFGCTFQMINCLQTEIENCKLLYPATHKFMLGCYDWFPHYPSRMSRDTVADRQKNLRNNATYVHNRHATNDCGNAVRNCVVFRANAPALFVKSPGTVVENCLVRETEWDPNSSSASGTLVTGERVILRCNTIDTGGNSDSLRPGRYNLVERNRVTRGGLLQFDGAGINVGTHCQTGTVVRYNWVHDTNRQGIRFDSTTSRAGGGGVAHHNVVFSGDGKTMNRFKGDRHVLANLSIPFDTLSVSEGYGEISGMNEHTIVRNNLVAVLTAWSERSEHIPGIHSRNRIGTGEVRWLRDPNNLDFRPRSGSPLVDAGMPVRAGEIPVAGARWEAPLFTGRAPDIGAYEHGDEHYWIPGREEATASFPVPPDGAGSVRADADLMWLGAYRCGKHMVYFGSDRQAVEGAAETSPEFRGRVKNNIFSPGTLGAGREYFWRIDAVGPRGIRKGKTWSFRVGSRNKTGDKSAFPPKASSSG